jgi:two-component system CheB/CheR fusion protein
MFAQQAVENVFLEHGETLQEIFKLLDKTYGVNFSKYKEGTILRRIEREMYQWDINDLDLYLNSLKENPTRLQKLFQSLLIPLTSFFRDKKIFKVFKCEIVPEILNRPFQSESIRIWVPGCSTGEEVYSLGICLLENMNHKQLNNTKIQIFGTDVNTDGLQYARKGKYSAQKVVGVSRARLKRFFVKDANEYTISSVIRNKCLFARHNLLEDPPFLHLDIISCQNVLIYFNSEAQKRIFELFQAALNPGGFLLLGKAERVPKYLSSLSRYKPGVTIFKKVY